ncbi:methionine synthase [Glutamicibacter arilaitensis]|uniref:methionine synthase n=1 Tax=Glutamicibacter arilaitensis TaxID=256701 RepID=UPI003FD51083
MVISLEAGGAALTAGKQVAIRAAMLEQFRQHFVTTFIERLSGVDFEKRETVRIRNRYDASVPTVVGAVERAKPVFVEDANFLRSCTDRQIKWALPGSMTMVDTLYDAHYRSRGKLAWEFATILNQEARELEAAGVDVIQFDEPAFNFFFDEVADWGIAALERACEGLKAETVVHICFGDGIKANNDWKATLGARWRHYEKSFTLLQASSIDNVSLEPFHSNVRLEVVEMVGVANDAMETAEEVAHTLRNALEYVDADKLIASTNCRTAPYRRDVALAKLSALCPGAGILREEFVGALV